MGFLIRFYCFFQLVGNDNASDARVNGAEITVHQINQLLSRVPGVTEEAAPKLRQEVLTKLIDQQLAVEQALGKKLDRQPEVMAALEASKRDARSS